MDTVLTRCDSDAGLQTCALYPGSLGYEEKDAETFAAWGIDCTCSLVLSNLLLNGTLRQILNTVCIMLFVYVYV